MLHHLPNPDQTERIYELFRLAIGVAQSGLILTSNRGLREDMARLEAWLREDMKQLAERVGAKVK